MCKLFLQCVLTSCVVFKVKSYEMGKVNDIFYFLTQELSWVSCMANIIKIFLKHS